MTAILTMAVDLYVIRVTSGGDLESLLLRRACGARSPGSWEGVHGHLEETESAVDGAHRELREETGLTAHRLYNLSRCESFYLHRPDTVAVIPVFAALVPVAESEPVRLSAEHDASRWLPIAAAIAHASWPRAKRALSDVGTLLPRGDAGCLEDVLRIC